MIGLATPLTAQAYFCIVQRADGVGLCATSHDHEVEREGLSYDPAPGLAPAELRLSDDLFSSSMTFGGALTSSGLREDDLAAGRWAAASLLFSSGDWSESGTLDLLCKGELGAVRAGDGVLTAELDLVPPSAREQPCPQTSPECRAQLGDRHCRVGMRSRRARLSVSAVDGRDLLVEMDDLERFRLGTLRWLSGPNCGIDHLVLNVEKGRIILRESPAYPAIAGDKVLLTEGCDGRLQTCSERFGNVVNFRGEPHLPGTDFVTRYPGE